MRRLRPCRGGLDIDLVPLLTAFLALALELGLVRWVDDRQPAFLLADRERSNESPDPAGQPRPRGEWHAPSESGL